MRVLKFLVLAPLVVIVLAFAIANRAMTTVSFDPFSSSDAASPTIAAPLFLVLLLTLMLGVVLGGLATWLSQGRYRQEARYARQDAERARAEAERLRAHAAAGRTADTYPALPSG